MLSFPLFRLAGIPVRMSLFLPIYFVLTLVTTPGYGQPAVFLALLVYFGVLAGSTLLHECGHAFSARRDGLRVHEITISMLGGYTVHDESRTTGGAVRGALAGVAVNFVIAAAAGAAIWGMTGAMPGTPRFSAEGGWLACIWGINVFLALFNLLPGIPFDGGHATEALLAKKFPRYRAKIAVLTSGLIIAAALVVLGLTGHSMLMAMLGFWCLSTVLSEWRALREEPPADEPFLGTYDFSNGYTSLEKGAPKPPPRESRADIRRREREKADAEAREAAAAREVRDSKVRLDRLLDRIAADGISSLTTEERAFLNEQSRRLRDRGRSPTR